MLLFNELRFSPDNKNLIIDVSIKDIKGLEDAVIDYIAIDRNIYTDNGPSDLARIYTVADKYYDIETGKYYDKVYATPPCNCNPVLVSNDSNNFCLVESNRAARHIRLVLPLSALEINPNNDMVFVYAAAKPDIECPSRIMGTVVNLRGIYDTMLSHIREIEKACSIPMDFIDDILKLKAFETSIKTGNYLLAMKYWNLYIIKATSSTSTNKCGCYGSN